MAKKMKEKDPAKQAEKLLKKYEELDAKKKNRSTRSAMVNTSEEGGAFQVLTSIHEDTDGTIYGPDEPAGAVLESDHPLDELFPNKFKRVDGFTRLGRDETRKQLTSNVMDRPYADRLSIDDEEDDEEVETPDSEEDEEETPKTKKVSKLKAMRGEDGDANPMDEDDDEEVDRAARIRKGKKSKKR